MVSWGGIEYAGLAGAQTTNDLTIEDDLVRTQVISESAELTLHFDRCHSCPPLERVNSSIRVLSERRGGRPAACLRFIGRSGSRRNQGPVSGGDAEHDPVDLDARSGGEPTIPTDAHIRLSSPDANAGPRMLRRGYSFSESSEARSGEFDAGHFFISFQRDPRRQFVPVQRRLSESDALNRHILHDASALFACPPGVGPGGFIGEGLFA